MARNRIVVGGVRLVGLAVAKGLKRTPTASIVIDRTNRRLLKPLLYQVATSVLAPAQLATPSRGILCKQKNATVILREVSGVDKQQKCVGAAAAPK